MSAIARREEAPPARRSPMVPEVRLNTDVDVFTLAEHLAKSGYFEDCKQASQAVVKILRGAELGIPPVTAMSEITIGSKGKLTLSYPLMLGLIQNSGRFSYEVVRCDPEGTMLEWREGSRVLGRTSFTLEDARKAKLLTKDVRQAYPEDMCFARAVSRGARRFLGAIFNGSVYIPGEVPEEEDRPVPPPPSRVATRAAEVLESASATSYADAVIDVPPQPPPEPDPPPLAPLSPPEDPEGPFALCRPKAIGLQGERAVERVLRLWAEGETYHMHLDPLPAGSTNEQWIAWAKELDRTVAAEREVRKQLEAEEKGASDE